MCDFVFCYGSSNERKLSKYIKDTKKGLRLYVSDREYFYVEIKKTNRKNLVINFEDSLKFIKFLVKNKIHCQLLNNKHSCGFCKNYRTYFQYIVQNKHVQHIKLFVGKFIPMIRSICEFVNFNLSYVIEDKQIFGNNNIDLEIVKYIFEIGNLIDVDYIVEYTLKTLDDVGIDLLEIFIGIYKQKITYFFTEDFGNIGDLLNTVLNMWAFIIPAFKTDNVNLFNYVVEELSNITDDINEEELDKNQIVSLNKIKQIYIYSELKIGVFLNTCIYNSFDCPNVFKQLMEDYVKDYLDIDSFAYNFFRKILDNNKFACAGILCEKINGNQRVLKNLLFYTVSTIDEARILVDYELDYEKIYEDPGFNKLAENTRKIIEQLVKETDN
ncbi:hypothetical protein [Acanthamoeba polyphaga mimivirus]|nr:hypothetical protein [Acanthamoeba castellanii mamavirus]UMZ08310.1 hypothetical protein [Acanthamoeba polyphaga mimivirus]